MKRLQRNLIVATSPSGNTPVAEIIVFVSRRWGAGNNDGSEWWSAGAGASSSTPPLDSATKGVSSRGSILRGQLVDIKSTPQGFVEAKTQEETPINSSASSKDVTPIHPSNLPESAEARLVSMEDAYHANVDTAWSKVPKVKLYKTQEERQMSEGFEEVHANRERQSEKAQQELDYVLARDELMWGEGSPAHVIEGKKKATTPVSQEGLPSYITPLSTDDLIKKLEKSGVREEQDELAATLEEVLTETKTWTLKRDGKSKYNLPNLGGIARLVGRDEMDAEMKALDQSRVFTEVGEDSVVHTFLTRPNGDTEEIDAQGSQHRASKKRLEAMSVKKDAADLLQAARRRNAGGTGTGINLTKSNLKARRPPAERDGGLAAASSLNHGVRTLQARRDEQAKKDKTVPGGGQRGGNDIRFPEKVKLFKNLSIHHKRRKDFFIAPKHLPLDTPSTNDVGLEQLVRYDREDLAENPVLVQQRKLVEKTKDQVRRREIHEKSPTDVVDENALNLESTIRKLMLRHYERFPCNLMITETFALVTRIQQSDGDLLRVTPIEMHIAEARELAKAHGLDLIRKSKLLNGRGDTVAVCSIEDNEAKMQSLIEHEIKNKGLAPRVRPCVEVGFRGVTRDFMVEVKSKFIAEFLFRKYPVRVSVKEYGTPREGFPVLEQILHTVKAACRHMKAFHTSSRVRSSTNEISLYLHPDTTIRTPSRGGALPPGGFHHPSATDINLAMETQLLDDQQEIHVDNWALQDRQSTNKYAAQVANGQAWGTSVGMKPGQMRKLKRSQGWLPKSNRKIHSQRHDNDMGNTEFRKERDETLESNVDQSLRASSLLTMRQDMSIEEMHDTGHTADETGVVNNFYYSMGGADSLQLGHMKNELGLGRNKKRGPKRASGFATQGVAEASGVARDGNEAFGGSGM